MKAEPTTPTLAIGSARSPTSDQHRRPESGPHDPFHPPSSSATSAPAVVEEEEEMKREVHLSATATKILYFEGDEKSVVEEHFSRCGYGDGAKESVVSEKGKQRRNASIICRQKRVASDVCDSCQKRQKPSHILHYETSNRYVNDSSNTIQTQVYTIPRPLEPII